MKIKTEFIAVQISATALARGQKQVVGTNRDYYITLEQLKVILKSIGEIDGKN